MNTNFALFGNFRQQVIATVVFVVPCFCMDSPAAERTQWLFAGIHCRAPITVKAGIYSRKDALVAWQADFAVLLKSAGVAGALDPNSIRVAADAESGAQKEVPCTFSVADGEVLWEASGAMEALENRRFWVYFDAISTTPQKSPQYPSIPGVENRPRNQVRNPGFEQADAKDSTQPAEWMINRSSSSSKTSKGALTLVNEPCRSGKRALKLHCTEGTSFGVRQEKISIKPNALYRIGVWARAEPGSMPEGLSMYMYISAVLYQANGKPVETPQTRFDVSATPAMDRWTPVKKLGLYPYRSDVPTPPDTAYCCININLSGDPPHGRSAVGIVYIDDVEVIEVRPQDKVPPVEVEAGAVEKAR